MATPAAQRTALTRRHSRASARRSHRVSGSDASLSADCVRRRRSSRPDRVEAGARGQSVPSIPVRTDDEKEVKQSPAEEITSSVGSRLSSCFCSASLILNQMKNEKEN